MIEGVAPDFSSKTFCNSCNSLTINDVTTENLLNEMTSDKRKGGEDFLAVNITKPRRKKPMRRCSYRRHNFIPKLTINMY